jgi:hypothetical protein
MNRIAAVLVISCTLLAPLTANADPVLYWNEIAARLPGAPNPFEQSRRLAIVQLSVFEAVNAITGEYEPYLGGAVTPAPGASVDAAAIQAAYRALRQLYPGSAVTLDAELAAALAALPDEPAKLAGIATGESAALAVLASRVNDGAQTPAAYLPASAKPGEYQLTTSCAAGVLFHWQHVRPFALPSVADFIAPPPPALGSVAYAKDYAEVHLAGSATAGGGERPQDRADVARLYAVSSPGYIWSLAARQVAAVQGRSSTHTARTLAVMAVSINDALIVSFASKYTYKLWRPETAIRSGDTDGNARTAVDPSFATYLLTPCFPSYPSNHASGSNGGAEALRRAYGEGEHVITMTNPFAPAPVSGMSFSYDTFDQLCNDIDDARVYAGIHFRFDQDAGNRLGREVATYVHKNLLRPVH